MEFRNTKLYDKLRRSIADACKDSISWRPHSAKYQELTESILAEEIIRRNIDWWEPNRPIADEAALWLTHLFQGYQEETKNGLVWKAKAFDHVYSRFEDFLYQDTYAAHFVSPLGPFSWDSAASIKLETGVYIRKPNKLLSNILKGSELNIEYYPNIWDSVVDVIIEQPKSVQRESGDNYTAAASKKLRMTLQSLRLLHQGKVFVGPLYHLIYPQFAGFKRNIGVLLDTDLTTLPLTPSYFVLSGYQLRESEVQELKIIYRSMAKQTSRYPDFFVLALSRFNGYFDRKSELDELVDLVIALEALFAKGRQKIGASLALRCSYFLEPDIERRSALLKRLRDIYDIRSCIVHGRAGLPKKWRKLKGEDYEVALASIVDDAAGYVRQTIRKIIADKHLDKFQNLSGWRKFLDQLVLRGST